MCISPSTSGKDPEIPVDPVANMFAGVLRQMFHDEGWDSVEPSARRAWRQVELITGTPWADVVAIVRAKWIVH